MVNAAVMLAGFIAVTLGLLIAAYLIFERRRGNPSIQASLN
jgi:hypothetical protein